jgi:membrane protease YdiL (CAAX protease family)
MLLVLPHALAFFIGLPFFLKLVEQIIVERGAGLPADGAWPNVTWARAFGGYMFVVACILLHLGTSIAIMPLLGLLNLPPQQQGLIEVCKTALLIGQWLVSLGLLLAYVAVVGRAKLETLGLTWRRGLGAAWVGGRMLLATMAPVLVVLLSAYYLYTYFTQQAPAEHEVLQTIKQGVSPWQTAVLVAVAGLIIPLFEEIFWRGLIQTSLMRTGRAEVAIVLTAFLFGAAHISDQSGGVTGVPALMVLGLGLGYAYYRTRSLVAPFVMHSLFNGYNLALAIFLPQMQDLLKNITL